MAAVLAESDGFGTVDGAELVCSVLCVVSVEPVEPDVVVVVGDGDSPVVDGGIDDSDDSLGLLDSDGGGACSVVEGSDVGGGAVVVGT